MTNVPDHVLSAASPPPKPRTTRTSPYQPFTSRYYPKPMWEWRLLYGPTVAFAILIIALAFQPQGNKDLAVLALLINVTLVVPLTWRAPQELRRSRARTWHRHMTHNMWEWHDPSGEWHYARLQGTAVNRALRWTVVLAMPAAWGWAFARGGWWFFSLIPIIGVLVYLHRHLPTVFRPAMAQRECDTCGMVRSTSAVRLCPRCGRVAEIEDYPALPALQRRWRDL